MNCNILYQEFSLCLSQLYYSILYVSHTIHVAIDLVFSNVWALSSDNILHLIIKVIPFREIR